MTLVTAAGHSIDDYLGPRQGRFFGEGFKRVEHHLADLEVGGVDCAARADACLSYPRDWSRKSSAALAPHLSTIDALVLMGELGDAYLTHTYGLADAERARMWLGRAEIQAGRAPEENLRRVPMALTRPPGGNPRGLSAFHCRIGAMRARCDIHHDAPSPARPGRSYRRAEEVLGNPEARVYGSAYRRRHHEIDDVQVGADRRSVNAGIAVAVAPAGHGLEGSYQPSFSMIDGLVTLAQLAQVLIYELDALDRADSSTLWMRRVRLERPAAPERLPKRLHAEVRLEKSALLRHAGGVWRTLEVSGSCGDLDCQASLAHRLPAHSR